MNPDLYTILRLCLNDRVIPNSFLYFSTQVMPPVSVITPALISSIRGQPHLPHHAWYFLTGVTLSVLNLPHEISTVFKHAIEKGPGSSDTKPGHDEQLEIARKMREALGI